jgi:hypothetical protein
MLLSFSASFARRAVMTAAAESPCVDIVTGTGPPAIEMRGGVKVDRPRVATFVLRPVFEAGVFDKRRYEIDGRGRLTAFVALEDGAYQSHDLLSFTVKLSTAIQPSVAEIGG